MMTRPSFAWYTLSVFVLALLLFTEGQPVTTQELLTRYGRISIKIVGDLTIKGKTPVIAIPGAAESLQDEWLPFAIQLAASMNCVCVLVNLNTIARPWITKDIISALSIQVLHNTLKAKQAIILGKSYGGLLANEFAMQHQQQVTALILFAPATPPAFSVERLCTLQPRIPIFLGWSKNDASYSHHGKYVEQCDAKDKFFMFHSEYYGEHAITKEYFAPMMEFLNLHIPRLV